MSEKEELNTYFEALRKKEFSRLDKDKQVYLDFTGGNLYPQSLLDKHFDFLKNNTLGNPHSSNPSSLLATKMVESARAKVLSFFNAEDYYCIFTSNASGALQIVGENYPFNDNSCFLLTSDNHNSVNGIREYCKERGGKYQYTTINYEDLQINEAELLEKVSEYNHFENKLFAYPAQSNVSGVKHDLKYIQLLQDKGWDVLLDAAAFVPTSKLDLQVVKPNFVCLSFYKMFGYPTGLGCLLVRKDSFSKLNKHWFAGGTVSFVAVNYDGYYLVNNHERFENGTLNYLDIPAIELGLNFIEKIGLTQINKRVMGLTEYLVNNLLALHHENGKPLVKVFGPHTLENHGSNIIVNFFDPNEQAYPFEYLQVLSNKENISIRSGCFCNPGIDEINSCMTTDELSSFFSSRDHRSYKDMVSYLGKMRGAIRISIGIPTIEADLDILLNFSKALLNKEVPQEALEMVGAFNQ
jgi:molybdenum cofactor sulfurtransferase